MNTKIAISALSSISSLGNDTDTIWKNYNSDSHFLSPGIYGNYQAMAGALSTEELDKIQALRVEDPKYKPLDNSVLYAMLVARDALKSSGWQKGDVFGVNIGSSRGATSLFEKFYDDFLKDGNSSTLASPTTTLGNISSWIAHDLQTKGPDISHSITCSTALHAVVNGVAWISSGMCDKFMVGGSEAALTPFTIAQIKALKIYAEANDNYPCKALDLTKKRNTMVLGEGAAVVCLEENPKVTPLAYIKGIGYATEILKHNISISKEADCFQDSMNMALKDTDKSEVDVIVMHAPGTIKGDLTELKAINKVFKDKVPALTTNKWKIGHTFGASGVLSLELAILMLKHQKFIKVPYIEYDKTPKNIKNVMINAVGFGGNAVSILVGLED